MKTGVASGLEILVLVFAVTLLSVPIGNVILPPFELDANQENWARRSLPFVFALCGFAGIPPLRRAVWRMLATPIPAGRRAEVLVVGVCKLAIPFAVTGWIALSIWIADGPLSVERQMAINLEAEMAQAYSVTGFVALLFATLVAPFVEELIFRGFLYRAVERRWGWFLAALVSAIAFALYHPNFPAAFISGLVFACLMRRTGSLWAPMTVHAFTNLMLWWPYVGQFVFPDPSRVDLGNLGTWTLHFVLGVLVLLAVPAYVWMARSEEPQPEPEMGQLHAALPR